ncbi:MAG: FAD-dependent oxidoreductase [Verrucomicrobiota bacterium]
MRSLWGQAIGQRLAHSWIRLRLACGREGSSLRARLFADYERALLHEFGQSERGFILRSRSILAERGEGLRTYEIVLECKEPQDWEPGDLVYLRWQNSPVRISELKARLPVRSAPLRVLSYGHALRPPRWEQVSPEALLSEILDLHATLPKEVTWETLCRRQARIRPRVFTVSRVPERGKLPTIELIVSTVGGGRASGYLERLAPGECVSGHRLPHPHRLPCAHGFRGAGLCIVTGSALAGVLAHLRGPARLPPIWLVWGIKTADQAYYRDELRHYLHAGHLARLDIVVSRPAGDAGGEYVQDLVRREAGAIKPFLGSEGWVYVSGQKAMAKAVQHTLVELYGNDTVSQWRSRMRLVVSASG